MENRNKLRRGKNPKTYFVAGIITFVMLFLTLSYAVYCLLCYAHDNDIENIFTLDGVISGIEYILNPNFSQPVSEVIAEVIKVQFSKLWWLYLSVPFLFFLIATSGYGKDYRGVEKGGAEWATSNDEKQFFDHTGIPLGKDFYATITNPNVKEIGKNPHKMPEKKPAKKLKGSFYSPHNLNEIVIGGSGAGKSFRKIKPDIIQLNSSIIVNDPKGELYRDTAKLLLENGYTVKVLNMLDITLTDTYNPFVYMQSEQDVLSIADLFMKNASGEGAKEDFWSGSAKDLLTMIMLYLWKSPSETKTFGRVLRLVNSISYQSDKVDENCELAQCMKIHKINFPGDGASVTWESMKNTPQVTLGGIAKNLSTPLGIWATEDVDCMTATDEMDFDTIGTQKTAIFLIIPPARNPYKTIINIFYSQLFERLMYVARTKFNGRLPILVSCELDEFANCGQIPNFCETLAVVRSFNIRICIVLQGLSQLKALYKDTWEGIISNCSLFTFLGTNDLESKKYVVEKLGKTTVRLETKSHSQSNTGGSTSNNEQYDSRDLVTVDELPKILKKNSKFGGSCILFIDEFSPFYRPKFNTKNHPKSHLTGSSFSDGIPNNTDIIEVYENKIKPPKPPKCDVRKLIEDIEDFENGEEFLQMSEFEGDLLEDEEEVKNFMERGYN